MKKNAIIHLQNRYFLLYSIECHLMRGNFAKIRVFSSRLYLLSCLNDCVSVRACARAGKFAQMRTSKYHVQRQTKKQISQFSSPCSCLYLCVSFDFILILNRNGCDTKVYLQRLYAFHRIECPIC